MLSAGSHLSLMNSIVRRHRRKVSALFLLHNIYHRENLPMHEYLNRFVAARNIRVYAALDELSLVIPRCSTNQFMKYVVSECCCASVELAVVGHD